MSYKNRIESILKELNQGVYEKDEALKLILLSFLSGKSAFLYGPPGTAKSLVARRVALAFDISEKIDFKGDSALGNHSGDFVDFRTTADLMSSSALKSTKSPTSNTALVHSISPYLQNPRIRDEEKQAQKATPSNAQTLESSKDISLSLNMTSNKTDSSNTLFDSIESMDSHEVVPTSHNDSNKNDSITRHSNSKIYQNAENTATPQAAGFSKETAFCDDFVGYQGDGEGIYLSGNERAIAADSRKSTQNKRSGASVAKHVSLEKPTPTTNTFFAYLMNRFSTPEEIFGPIDIAELKQNRLTRSTQGYLPTAHFAFLDEIWKSSPAILNTLLTIINEKIYRDGNMDIKVPLKGLVCASNEFPTPNQGLEALYDRLIVRLKVLPVEKKASFEALLKGIDEAQITITKPFNLQELQDITQKAKSITFSTQSLKALHHLKSLIETHNKALDKDTTDLDFSLVSTQESEKIYISDRRWVAMAELLRVAAVLSDRDEVLPIDIMLLKHCLWSSESHIDIIQNLLAKALENTIHINLDEFDISHLQDEYEAQYELVKTEFYTRNKAKKVSQKKKDEYTKICDTLLESIMSLQERLTQIYNTQKSSLYNVFLSDTDYDIALQDIAEKQTQLELLYLALDQLKHIIARQIEPMPLKHIDKTKIIYHPKTKDELLNLIDDKSVYLGDIDTSAITDMSGLFRDSNRTDFSGIEYWDVSSVVNMSCMFYEMTNFNQSLVLWDVSKVEDMRSMFNGAKKFNQPLDFWNVSNVKDMRSMFNGATSFNQPLDSWDVSSVTDMYCMFENARKFNQPLNSWNVSSVEDMSNMFYGAKKFNQPLDFWNVSNVKDMSRMFCGASSFNQPLDSWNVRNVTKMQYMFKGATSFNQPLDSWNVSSVEDMSSMFEKATSFNHSLESWCLKRYAYTSNMFDNSGYKHPYPKRS